MLKELLDAIAAMAVKAAEMKPLPIADPRSQTFYIASSGERLEIEIPPKPRSHGVNSLEDLIALAKRFDGAGDMYAGGLVRLGGRRPGHRR